MPSHNQEMQHLAQDKNAKTASQSMMDPYLPRMFGSLLSTQKEKDYVDSNGVKIDLSKIPGCIQCQYANYDRI